MTVLALCCLLLGGCQQPDDAVTRLLRQLPADQALYSYLDLARIRNSDSLQPLLEGAGLPMAVENLEGNPGFDYRTDVEAAAFSFGSKGTQIALEGKFDERQLRETLVATGADCPGSLRQDICTIEGDGSHPSMWFLLRADDLLRIAVEGGYAAAETLTTGSDNQRLAVKVRERLEQGAVFWGTFAPLRAQQALARPPLGLSHLKFFARALEKADRGDFYAEELPDGKLKVTLQATCANASLAASVSNMLTGLNRLAAAALEAGRGDDPPPGVRVLRGARIANTESTVLAVWIVDEPALRAWSGVAPTQF